ncbi:MAG: hypothetical protein IT470_03905 [Pseudomonadales bacterium]|nr:hypothetical protein [Pseudomonadales bacterium]
MKDKFIAKVPDTYIPHPQLSARTQWSCSFNAACWVRLLQPRPCKISLIIKYVDQDGINKQTTVDTGFNDLGSSILLSGLVTIQVVGRIVDMGVYLESSENCPPYAVDELFVQSTDKAAAKAPKLVAIAN